MKSERTIPIVKILFLRAIYLAICSQASGAQIKIYPVDGATISEGEPDTVLGLSDGLSIYTDSTGITERTYFKFDLSGIPQGQKITDAFVGIGFGYISSPEPYIEAHYLENDDWYESTITWNNAPLDFDPNPMDTVLLDWDLEYYDYKWNVLEKTSECYSFDKTMSIVFKTDHENALIYGYGTSFWSMESNLVPEFIEGPHIMITYEEIPDPMSICFLGLGGLTLRRRRRGK